MTSCYSLTAVDTRMLTRLLDEEMDSLKSAPAVESWLPCDLSVEALAGFLASLEEGKPKGLDIIRLKFLKPRGGEMSRYERSWIFKCCLSADTATIIAVLKLNKPSNEAKSYLPSDITWVPFKVLEISLLHILKTSSTERRRLDGSGELIGDWNVRYNRHLVWLISNRFYILKTSVGQTSKKKRLKNGVQRGSSLSPILFNIYISNLSDISWILLQVAPQIEQG